LGVRYANQTDLEPAAAVLQSAARRLERAGKLLWDASMFSAEHLGSWMGELCVALEGAQIVGVMRLQTEDAPVWPDEPEGESLYVHKLAVADGWQGHGISGALLGFAQDQARARGCTWVRLDCVDRPTLRAVYERFGFRHRDMRQVGTRTACRYERRV
jgi:GNAT superfamily N-acetyltransferase